MSITKRKVYCVFGCSELGAYMHRFPHPTRRAELFTTWLSIVGERLKDLEPDKIYRNKRVCDYHFKPEHKVSCHRLLYLAIPSLHLTGVFSSPGTAVLLEHNYSMPRMWPTETKPIENVDVSQNQQSLDKGLQDRLQPDVSCQPSTSQHTIKGLQQYSNQHLLKQYKLSQKQNRKLKTKLKKSIAMEKNYKTRLANAEKLVTRKAFHKVTEKMSEAGKIFTGMQYKQALKKPKGRRYTTCEKVLALTLFKKSPKLYTLLYKYFTLPSAKSLRNLLAQIKISPGINKVIFEKLKDTVSGMNEEDRLCTLIFDEMSLTPNIQYDAANDQLKGLINHNNEMKIANHALVFMIKGIKKNFKQPVAYYFAQSLQKLELKNIIKDVIRHVHSTGLKILCTVCDQGATNVSALNSLVEDTKAKYLKNEKEWRHEIFEVDSKQIIPLFDVPHLIKGLRNNLLTKDLQYVDFEDENKKKIVKWEYFQMLYEADKSYGELRYLHKLTEEHVNPDKIKKMRVKMATQIFSHSVAVATEHLTARKNLPEECRQLIPVVLLLDKLFDSLNAGSFNIMNGKIYRGCVKKNSPHHKLWLEGIKFLKNVIFIAKKKDGNKIRLVETSAPSIKNFIKTIEGMQRLWNILNKKYSLDSMLTRNFNQDPIENFFGNIRSLGVRNISPNCRAFEGAFKTVLLNNFSSAHAVNANCEEDFNKCLQNVDFFIKEKGTLKINAVQNEQNIEINENFYNSLCNLNSDNSDDHQQRKYVCGWVLTKCLSNIIKKCKCRSSLLSSKADVGNEYIRAKEYNIKKKWLCYPSNPMSIAFNEIQDITTAYLKSNITTNNIKGKIKLFVESFVAFPHSCDVHQNKFKDYFSEITINILIYSWCRSMNRILSGKLTYVENDDPLKKYAQDYYNKHKHHK